jgi:hypothetical protein
MMGGKTPETCWAVHKRQVINLSNVCIYLLDLYERFHGVSCTGVRHPQHTQTCSNSSTIAADSSNGVTNTTCCRYSCMRSWWWVEVPPKTCRAVSRNK